MKIKRMPPMIVIIVFGIGSMASAAVIPATDPGLRAGLSAYNWVCMEDSIHASVAGASLTLGFKGTRHVSLQVDTTRLANVAAGRHPILAWTVNGGEVNSHQLAAGESSVVLSTDIANPVIDLYLKGMSPFEDRWNGDVPTNSVRITGFEVDAGGSTVAVNMTEKVWLNIGDSILSGDGAAYPPAQGRPPDGGWAAASDGRASYGFLLARHFGFRESRIAYGGYNWGGGMAGLPALARLIDQASSTQTRLTGDRLHPSPDVVMVNLGENGVPSDAEVIGALTHLRSRIGMDAKMLVMVPVSGKGRMEISRAFAGYQSETKDPHGFLIDLGEIHFDTADGQHPTAGGHQHIFEIALGKSKDILAENSSRPALGEPFWESSIMSGEPILFVQQEGNEAATGKLLFKPNRELVLTSPDGQRTYENGRDYVWKAGADTIVLKPGSRIPFKTASEMIPPGGGPNTFHGLLHAEGHFFHDLQVLATYQHPGNWDWHPPANENRLAGTLARLMAKQPVKIVALGDSITEGYNASGFAKVNVPPYQPAFPELVANTLQERFGSEITLVNLGLGGQRAEWGIGEVPKVTEQKPDLVILAFGMNHNEGGPAFGETMGKLLAAIQAGSPGADVVLVSSMAGHPHIFPEQRFTAYRDALAELQAPNVALADVTTPWLELTQRKPFADLSGNHVNHPNDFSHRLYAHVICHLFLK